MNQAVLMLNEPISPPRIGGVATAIALHIVGFMLLMVPLSYTPPTTESDATPDWFDKVVPIIKEPPPPPPPLPRQVEQKKPEIVPLTTIRTVTPPVPVTNATYNDANPVDIPYTEPVSNQGPIEIPYVAPPSGPISLSTLFAPAPRYPTTSLRNGEEGTVILLVRVDAAGLPLEISIQKSSGHRELDRAAKKHVLDTWRFHPAMHQGSAIPALALVPVEFKISG
jgi:periplasmic protein TonB